MRRKVLRATVLALFLLATVPVSALSDEEAVFVLGFRTLAGLIPEVAGVPLENEHHNPSNGDGLQMTSTGLMVWRKADNWTAFTNGWWTWVNGPYGLQDRPNENRFDWELDASSEPGAGSSGDHAAPVGAPALAVYPTTTVDKALTTGIPSASATATVGPSPTSIPPTSTRTATPTPSPRPSATPLPTRRPTVTPRPTSTPQPTHTPTPTQTPKPTATPLPSWIRSADPAGQWVTSVATATSYYCSKDNVSCWQGWTSDNRIWFDTEEELLKMYPGRIRRD